MTRYLLDTNIISNATKPHPAAALAAWLGAQADDDLFIASLTLAEIQRGILEKPAGKKRRELEFWFSGADGPPSLFEGRILPFDAQAALIWAQLMADGTAEGRPRSALDTIIASVARANHCTIVTDNARHFAGLQTLNPMEAQDLG